MTQAGTTSREAEPLRCIVLAGGASRRLFPLNKAFADPTGCGRTLLQQALDRATASLPGDAPPPPVPRERFLVVTRKETVRRVQAQLGLDASGVLAEPAPHHTLPAILWALARLRLDAACGVVAVLTADHLIGDIPAFRRSLAEAVRVASTRPAIVTLGIPPDRDPGRWTSFGAIRSARGEDPARLEEFVEKPSAERAARMIAQGGWFWNSGMFVFRIATLEAALERLRPEMFDAYRTLAEAAAGGDRAAAARAFEQLPARIPHPHPEGAGELVENTIDYALMVPLAAKRCEGLAGYVVPGAFPWEDLGDWAALRRALEQDAEGNVRVGDARADGTRDSILVAEPGRRIEVSGLEGLVVVAGAAGAGGTGGWSLVTTVDRAPGIKPFVESLSRAGGRPVVACECRDVAARAESGRIALFGVRGVEVVGSAERLLVRPLAGDPLDRLARGVVTLAPAIRTYAWGGSVLAGHLMAHRAETHRAETHGAPVAEAWLTSTLPGAPCSLVESCGSLADLVRERPEVLGRWSRAVFGDRLPFFVKLLSTRFPPRAQLGFDPARLPDRAALLERLREEQRLLRKHLEDLDPALLRDPEGFARHREAYESWAVGGALAGWRDRSGDRELARALLPLGREGTSLRDLEAWARSLRENRAAALAGMCELDLRRETGNAVLVPAGTLHALFGLSHQIHPRDPARAPLARLLGRLRGLAAAGASDARLEEEARAARPALDAARGEASAPPKNEAWIPFEEGGGEILLAEVQQSSDATCSLLDAFTPFVWRRGGMEFRKGDPRTGLADRDLERFLGEVDLAPSPTGPPLRTPRELPPGPGARGARLSCLLDDPEIWPYFAVYRVDLHAGDAGGAGHPGGAGDAGRSGRVAVFPTGPPEGAFQQIAVLEGRVLLQEGGGRGRDGARHPLTPGTPAFVPATLEGGGYLLESETDASVLLLSLPAPRGGAPQQPSRAATSS